MVEITKQQRKVIQRAVKGSLFLEGAAGTGKTTVGVLRLQHLLEKGIPAGEILIMLPQKTLAYPYQQFLESADLAAGGQVTISTLGGLARRAIDIFFPMISEETGFRDPYGRPTFLSLETAQYYMARVVAPVIAEKGYFDTITIDRNRLYSQILDNLNKAALVGFPHTQLGERLKSAWIGEESQRRVYDDVQDCANRFRAYCLEHNLLDFSLQAEIYLNRLWTLPECQQYFTKQYKHLIVDNIEEDSPAAHDVLREWLPQCKSALVIYDTEAGYRRFLSADPGSGYSLRRVCDKVETFEESFVYSPDLKAFASQLAISLNQPYQDGREGDPRAVLVYEDHRYHPQMIDWTAEEITRLVNDEGVNPGEIVVIAPYLSDALRFSLMNRLETAQIPARAHRPSRSLREETASHCLLTLAQIAHPSWGMKPATFDVAYALMAAIEGLDLIRAQLLAQIVYRHNEGKLNPFDRILPEMQDRITFVLGGRYETLRVWLEEYAQNEAVELDHFLSRLFGEVLSQEGFGFHGDFGAAEVAANLIESARSFRWTIEVEPDGKTLAQEYAEMVQDGIIANQYIRSWTLDEANTVLIAPAYTFLMRNQPVDYQFWLNVGAHGWSERLYQPLTHPYVLTREWAEGQKWTDVNEVQVSEESLYKLALGLVRRCRKRIYLGFSELGEQGYDQRGALLDAIQRMLRRLSGGEVADV